MTTSECTRVKLIALLLICVLAHPIGPSGCGGGVIRRVGDPPPLPPSRYPVQLKVSPKDAAIFVDGAYHGTIDRYPEGWLALAIGQRRLKVTKIGYYAWYGLVKNGQPPTKLSIRLVPKPKTER